MSFSPFGLHEISVLIELILGHLRYFVTDVPPQPNFPLDMIKKRGITRRIVLVFILEIKKINKYFFFSFNFLSKISSKVVVFQF